MPNPTYFQCKECRKVFSIFVEGTNERESEVTKEMAVAKKLAGKVQDFRCRGCLRKSMEKGEVSPDQYKVQYPYTVWFPSEGGQSGFGLYRTKDGAETAAKTRRGAMVHPTVVADAAGALGAIKYELMATKKIG